MLGMSLNLFSAHIFLRLWTTLCRLSSFTSVIAMFSNTKQFRVAFGNSGFLLQVVPETCAGLVRWVHKTYNPKAIIITENGVSDFGTLEDDERISYYTVR